MNRALSTTSNPQQTPPLRAMLRLSVACLVLCASCLSATTSIDEVWSDSARPKAPLGRTLVVALLPNARVAASLEQAWARSLQSRGVDATALEALKPSVRPPGRPAIAALVRQRGFQSLLVSRRVDVKNVDRDAPSYQVAVVETKLYDAHTEQPFWSATTDTFLRGASETDVTRPGSEHMQQFVETLLTEMAKAKLL